MPRAVSSRYERTDDGRTIIDVAASRAEDLYEEFDKSAPYVRRDLDQDLGEYLIDSAKELDRVPFVVRFTLGQLPDDGTESRIRRSVNAYFQYLADRAREDVLQMFRRAAILFCLGLGILFLSVWLNQLLGPERSVVADVFAEGLTVAAWVSLWQSLVVVLVEWSPNQRHIRLLRRLACVELSFRAEPPASSST